MDPIKWFQQQVGWKGTGAAGKVIPKGSSLVPVPAVQQIKTNLKVPGGIPGAGIATFGARGSNFGIIDGAVDAVSREAVRGAQVVAGQDTTNFDSLNSGRPVVRNINGVSYNIATPEGKAGYQRALEAGGRDSTPSRTGSVDTPTPYPTEAVLETIKPSRDYQQEASGSGGGGGRTNSEGLVQYGQTLGGLNTFNEGFLGEGYDIADVKSTYQSEALPATDAGTTQLEKPVVKEDAPTQEITTGGNPKDPQDGASPQPDRVERIRQVAFNGNDSGKYEPGDNSDGAPKYIDYGEKRNEIRRTFLDYEGSSVKAAVAANAKAGYGKDSNGNARFNVGGELVNAKEGMEWKAKDAAMRGVDPSEFLQMKVAKVKEETEEL